MTKENENIISGLWWMSDIKKMMRFLDLPQRNNIYGAYCLEISDDEKNGNVHFNSNKEVYKVKIVKINDLKYEMFYRDKKRTITIEKDQWKDRIEYLWHFDDSSPHPPKSIAEVANDGRKFSVISEKYSISECLDEIENEALLDQAESEMEDPDDLRE
jgi:hypothetical protein